MLFGDIEEEALAVARQAVQLRRSEVRGIEEELGPVICLGLGRSVNTRDPSSMRS